MHLSCNAFWGNSGRTFPICHVWEIKENSTSRTRYCREHSMGCGNSHGSKDREQPDFDVDFRGRGVVGEKNQGRIRNRHAANRGDIDFDADRRRWGFGCISGPKFTAG